MFPRSSRMRQCGNRPRASFSQCHRVNPRRLLRGRSRSGNPARVVCFLYSRSAALRLRGRSRCISGNNVASRAPRRRDPCDSSIFQTVGFQERFPSLLTVHLCVCVCVCCDLCEPPSRALSRYCELTSVVISPYVHSAN